ncbi:MAG TPA: hypothetical protein VNC84_03960 [Gammaproteobacteria bacterium]|jgi:hypothetical protein|nr:hypothetical protein [Gammaproteobacteria bacterium]
MKSTWQDTTKAVSFKLLKVFLVTSVSLCCGSLALLGAYAIVSSPVFGASSFILATAFEGQIYYEAIGDGLNRIADPDRTNRSVIAQFLDKLIESRIASAVRTKREEKKRKIEEMTKLERSFRFSQAKSDEIEAMKAEIKRCDDEMTKLAVKTLETDSDTLARYYRAKKNKDKQTQTDIETKALILLGKSAKKSSTTYIDSTITTQLMRNRSALRNTMIRKGFALKCSWILSIAGGIACGLTTLSAVSSSIGVMTTLALVPGGALIAIAACAGIAFTLLLYQNLSLLVETTDNPLSGFYKKKEESYGSYALRTFSFVVVFALAGFCTAATVSTWWFAAKEGVLFLKIGKQLADIIRIGSLGIYILPSMIWMVSNSLFSLDKIRRSEWGVLLGKTMRTIDQTWQSENILCFINPFRVYLFIDFTMHQLLFLGHVITVGLMSNDFRIFGIKLNPVLTTSLLAASEILTDANYLPSEEEGHSHAISPPLALLFAPVAFIVYTLRVLAVGWDVLFSTSHSLEESAKKMNCKLPWIAFKDHVHKVMHHGHGDKEPSHTHSTTKIGQSLDSKTPASHASSLREKVRPAAGGIFKYGHSSLKPNLRMPFSAERRRCLR